MFYKFYMHFLVIVQRFEHFYVIALYKLKYYYYYYERQLPAMMGGTLFWYDTVLSTSELGLCTICCIPLRRLVLGPIMLLRDKNALSSGKNNQSPKTPIINL